MNEKLSTELLTDKDSRLENQPLERYSEIATLELLEERAHIEKVREVVGQLEVRREIERRVEQISVELVTETVFIEHVAQNAESALSNTGQAALTLELNGETVTLEPGQRYSFEIYRERAQVSKVVEVAEQVRIGKRTLTETQDITLELGRETLLLQKQGEVFTYQEGTSPTLESGDGSGLPAVGVT